MAARTSSLHPAIAALGHALALLLLLVCGCNDGPTEASVAAPFPRDRLLDPMQCKECHPNHYTEWSASMHAYAAQDPVFVAMNARGQRETNGQLGDFCVRCHAPMAVLEHKTQDGLNLTSLPAQYQGVTCYFCHNAESVTGDHNAMLQLANDTTMRGNIRDPVQPGVHNAAYSKLFNDKDVASSALCGSCHDIVTPAGVHLERTFAEYNSSLFSKPAGNGFDTCAGCHMRGIPGTAAQDPAVQVPSRTVHEHLWAGVDVPLTDFPHRDAMRAAVQDCALASSITYFTLDVAPDGTFNFILETGAGHNQPSGAAHDRRMWLDFTAYDANGAVTSHSGNIADGEVEDPPAGDPKFDPNLWMMRDHIFDANDQPVHMFWQAAASANHPLGYDGGKTLPVAIVPTAGTHYLQHQYFAFGASGLPARVSARLRMRPMGMDVLQDLVKSGDLDPAVVAQVPTFTLGDAVLDWTPADVSSTKMANPVTPDCDTYRCMLHDGTGDGCAAR